MLERRSALAAVRPYSSPVLSIHERGGFTLTQVAGHDGAVAEQLAALVGDVPASVGTAITRDGRTIMRTGPAQFWIIAEGSPAADDVAQHLQGTCAVTPLSHGRVRIAVEGEPARDVLSKLMPIDFHPSAFGLAAFAMTGIHHTPVTVHCVADNAFHLYVMRTFAQDLWEVITDAALEFAA